MAHKYSKNKVMFIADTHFGHANIIKYCNRPFPNVAVMDATMIDAWNSRVQPDQTVFHLGDFSLSKGRKTPSTYLDRLNGDVVLIKGNHDHRKDIQHFNEVHEQLEIMVDGQLIFLCHYRMDVWPSSHRGSWHLHGHSHGTLEPRMDRKVFDIGVDSWNFQPVDFTTVRYHMMSHGQEPCGSREGR